MKKNKCGVTRLNIVMSILVVILSLSPAILAYEEPSKEDSNLQTYIVHVKPPKSKGELSGEYFLQDDHLESWYRSFLPAAQYEDTSNQQPRLLFTYKNAITGFAAKLTAEEAKAMEDKEGFVSARPEKVYSLHTTHSPSFLGLTQGLGLWKGAYPGKGMIIGVLDSGANPNHPSFSDKGIPPPPAKWKGKCEVSGNRTCNNKLIGARNFVRDAHGVTPFDDDGHGTHTASTAAGSFVGGANVFGNAKGTAVGMAPYAHLAIYRVCSVRCPESSILAGLDAAIEDGVDVLSLSLGGGSNPLYSDSTAIGAFGAVQKGIFVSCSAGNAGPYHFSLSNEAPWILTVGASTIDRRIRAMTKLGNGAEFDGESLFQPKFSNSTLYPLVYAGENGNQSSAFCAPGALKNVNVKGKVVLCEGGIPQVAKGKEVKAAGGIAMVLANPKAEGFSTFADAHVLPAAQVSYAAGLKIKQYMKSTPNPTATILFKGTIVGNDPLAPAIAYFSSRGPSNETPGILKPDIIGPGVNILAAWHVSVDNMTQFNVISGTSMSCPHLSGIAALLKSSHPDWSPAAIKSALMTTAQVNNRGDTPIVDQTHEPADIFATGAGHVNPSKANDPGLIYDIDTDDYIRYLCGLRYKNQQVSIIVRREVDCSKIESIPEAQLNYPSFSIFLNSYSQNYTRTVTNVGPAKAMYTLELVVPLAVEMKVNPSTLYFTEVNQKATFSVEFIPKIKETRGSHMFSQGSLTWVSAERSVRIPISVIFA